MDAFTTALEPGEIIREIMVPVEDAGTGTSYQKMVQPASGFAIVGVAARVRRSGGKITMARIGVTGLVEHRLSRDGGGEGAGGNRGIGRRISRRLRRWCRRAWMPTPICTLRRLSPASGDGVRGARDQAALALAKA